ncbi:KTSC domain-containing protein [Stenotrophomonas sp.]|uniref:KTSC domain-containing protein n=1 Tax=Stenotrophomonas sp. TaxID=69392 RepID=UPI00289E569F|nr:KTSC domain-containing protein [Stenotrophomonas sp.]
MNREPVASSNIAAIGYDEPSQTLEVEFTGGAIYQYYNVPLPIFEQLMQSSSKGQFLAHQIKNSYAYSRTG